MLKPHHRASSTLAYSSDSCFVDRQVTHGHDEIYDNDPLLLYFVRLLWSLANLCSTYAHAGTRSAERTSDMARAAERVGIHIHELHYWQGNVYVLYSLQRNAQCVVAIEVLDESVLPRFCEDSGWPQTLVRQK